MCAYLRADETMGRMLAVIMHMVTNLERGISCSIGCTLNITDIGPAVARMRPRHNLYSYHILCKLITAKKNKQNTYDMKIPV